MTSQIQFWNRYSKKLETEKVYGQKPMEWAYNSQIGRILTNSVLSKRIFSEIYGSFQNTSLSKNKINSFIQNFNINMNEYESGPFNSFNEFFIRRFKPNSRMFTQAPTLPAFAEGRYFGFNSVHLDTQTLIKGIKISVRQLLANSKWENKFMGGPCFIARLCPVDYHRFHFPDSGKVLDQYTVHGKYHSVNPTALAAYGDILMTNERSISILQTQSSGLLAYIEVGAMCVGRIVQSYPNPSFKRGDEKGYFLFGGSTVVLLGEPGRLQISQDILDNTAKGTEVFVKLGDEIARS